MMNWNQIVTQWERLSGNAKSRWTKLTDDDLAAVSGDREALVGKIEERYAVLPNDAETQVDEWGVSLGLSDDDEPVPESLVDLGKHVARDQAELERQHASDHH
jgi:uncharacterized protein YjbJ (UPF0337 family)